MEQMSGRKAVQAFFFFDHSDSHSSSRLFKLHKHVFNVLWMQKLNYCVKSQRAETVAAAMSVKPVKLKGKMKVRSEIMSLSLVILLSWGQ